MQVNKKTITIVAVIIGLAVLIGVYIAIRSVSSSLKKIESAAFSPTEQTIPCNGNPVSKIEIGRIFAKGTGEPSGEFTTTGGDIFIVGRGIESSAVLDFGNTAIIKIGQSLKQTEQKDPAYKIIDTLNICEDEYNKITLEPGHYLIWPSRGVNIEIVSCTPNGVSYPLPQK